jgi:hypothetical protein
MPITFLESRFRRRPIFAGNSAEIRCTGNEPVSLVAILGKDRRAALPVSLDAARSMMKETKTDICPYVGEQVAPEGQWREVEEEHYSVNTTDDEGWPVTEEGIMSRFECSNCGESATSYLDTPTPRYHPVTPVRISGKLGFNPNNGQFVLSAESGSLTVLVSGILQTASRSYAERYISGLAIMYSGFSDLRGFREYFVVLQSDPDRIRP